MNPGLLHCRQILYCLSHQGSPELELLFSNAWGRLFTSCLSAQACPFVFCFMVLEVEICKSHFPECLATAFLFSSADESPWKKIRTQRREKELFFHLPFPSPVRLHSSSYSSSLCFCHSVYFPGRLWSMGSLRVGHD